VLGEAKKIFARFARDLPPPPPTNLLSHHCPKPRLLDPDVDVLLKVWIRDSDICTVEKSCYTLPLCDLMLRY